jgi:hypothetical protein
MDTYTDTFTASVQYGDWRGTCKADNADSVDLRTYVKERKLVRDGEFLVAFSLYNGENSQDRITSVHIQALLVRATNYEAAKRYLDNPDPVRVRKADIEMSIDEFFRLFKRFSIALSWQDLDMAGREFCAMTSRETAIAFSRWQHDMLELQNVFVDVKRQSALFQRFNEIGKANPQLVAAWRESNPFPHGLSMWYGYYSSAAIRRFCDRDRESRSLVTLLREMAGSSVLTTIFGDSTSAAELLHDSDEVIEVTKREKHFVDRAICHTDKRGVEADKHPTFNQTFKTIGALEPLFRKYCDLFGLRAPLDPKLPPDWDEIFSFPWIDPMPRDGP